MKRTLAVLLVLAVLACALGMAALAEDGDKVAEVGSEQYESLDAALTAAASTENATVTLLKNIELSSAVEVKSSVTIAGDGHTISRGKTEEESADYTGTFFTVSGEDVKMTLSDVVIDAGGNWTLNEGGYNEALTKSTSGVASNANASLVTNSGIATTAHLITLADGASLDVTGGSKITNFYTANGSHIVQITSGEGYVSLTDCEISHNASTSSQFIVYDANDSENNTITVDNGCVIDDNFAFGNGGLFLVGHATTLEIKDKSEITNNTAIGNGTVVMVYKYNSTDLSDKLIISGGKISGNVGIWGDPNGSNHFCCPIYIHRGGEFEMSDGEITGNTGCFVGAIIENENATSFEITGGTIEDNYYYGIIPEAMATQGYPSAGMGEIFIGGNGAVFGEDAVIDSDVYVGWGGQLENSGTINGDTYVYATKSGERQAQLNNTKLVK